MTLANDVHLKHAASRGFGVIEMMVILTVVALLLAIAGPALKSAFARAGVKSATENVSQAFRIAKNTAQASNKAVTLTFTTGNSANSVLFSFPGGVPVTLGGLSIRDIDLPDKIAMVANPAVFTFDPMGNIVGFNNSSNIVLASTLDASKGATVRVVNGMGYITIDAGIPTP